MGHAEVLALIRQSIVGLEPRAAGEDIPRAT
jgi:hypothetical protein